LNESRRAHAAAHSVAAAVGQPERVGFRRCPVLAPRLSTVATAILLGGWFVASGCAGEDRLEPPALIAAWGESGTAQGQLLHPTGRLESS
jgi:hypothetical protein